MKFTLRFNVVPIACGVLTIVAVGWSESVNRAGSAPAPIVAAQDTAVQKSFQTNGGVRIISAVENVQPAYAQRENFLPVAWYKDKHWWKRNAPIIGAVAGGGLIGGLAGGGKGLIIGGAAGAGGGYLYKHFRDRDHHHSAAYRASKPTPHQVEHGR